MGSSEIAVQPMAHMMAIIGKLQHLVTFSKLILLDNIFANHDAGIKHEAEAAEQEFFNPENIPCSAMAQKSGQHCGYVMIAVGVLSPVPLLFSAQIHVDS
jgi:hypothetical protein